MDAVSGHRFDCSALRARRDLSLPGLLGAGALLALFVVDVAHAAPRRSAGGLRLAVTESAALEVTLTVEADKAPTFQVYRGPGLNDAVVYVVELPGVAVGGAALSTSGPGVLLHDARVEAGRKGSADRVILTFADDVDFDAAADKGTLAVRFTHTGDRAALFAQHQLRLTRVAALTQQADDARRSDELAVKPAEDKRTEQERRVADGIPRTAEQGRPDALPIVDEQRAAAQRIADERVKNEQRAAEAKRLAQEQQRVAEERRVAEEKRVAEDKRVADEKRLQDDKRQAEERRVAELKRITEDKRAAEQQRLEEQRAADERRVAQEKRLADEKRAADEKRLAEQKRIADEKRIAEEKRVAELKRVAEEKRLAEEQRLAELKRVAAEARAAELARSAEAKRLADAMKAAELEAQRVAVAKAAAERAAQQQAQEAQRLAADTAKKQAAERAAQARLEEARKIEQQRLEQQRIEQQRVEQQRLEQQRLEQQRREQQRLEQQRLEQQRLEQQRLEQRLEQQRLEQQRLEQQRVEQQRLEQQRVEQQRLEQQRALERQRQQQLDDDNRRAREQERLAEQRRREQPQPHALKPARPDDAGFGGRSIEIARPNRYQRYQPPREDEDDFGGDDFGDDDALDESGGRSVLSHVTVQRTSEGARVGVHVDGGARYQVSRRGRDKVVLTLFDTRVDGLDVRRALDARALGTSVLRVLPTVEEDGRFRVQLVVETRGQTPVKIDQDGQVLWLGIAG